MYAPLALGRDLVISGTFTGNQADHGGAVWVQGDAIGDAVVADAVMNANGAASSGGCLHAAAATVFNVSMTNCTAYAGGGARLEGRCTVSQTSVLVAIASLCCLWSRSPIDFFVGVGCRCRDLFFVVVVGCFCCCGLLWVVVVVVVVAVVYLLLVFALFLLLWVVVVICCWCWCCRGCRSLRVTVC